MTKTPENPGECYCCGFVTEKLEYFPQMDTTIAGGGKVIYSDFWFCKLCCGSIASAAHRYPGHYPDYGTMKTVCYVGNVILARLAGPTGSGQ